MGSIIQTSRSLLPSSISIEEFVRKASGVYLKKGLSRLGNSCRSKTLCASMQAVKSNWREPDSTEFAKLKRVRWGPQFGCSTGTITVPVFHHPAAKPFVWHCNFSADGSTKSWDFRHGTKNGGGIISERKHSYSALLLQWFDLHA